jgi:FkbM family methyltransferase
MPTSGWVIDLGANRGLFSVWAALTGANVVAVEAQQGFATEISDLAAYNGVAQRVHVEIAMASGVTVSGATVGVVADDHRWATTSHGAAARPADLSLPQLMSVYHIERVGLLKVDIEGGEFAVFGDNDLHWLEKVDQLALEVHPAFGDAVSLIAKLERNGFTVDLRNNDGEQLTPASDHLEYVYCRRQREGGIASRRRSPGPSPSSTTRS